MIRMVEEELSPNSTDCHVSYIYLTTRSETMIRHGPFHPTPMITFDIDIPWQGLPSTLFQRVHCTL